MKKINNKGFTLIELIVVIGILSLIFGLFSINFIRELDESKRIQNETVQNEIVEAAKAYVELHKTSNESKYDQMKNVLYNSSTTPARLCVKDIINDGLINTNVIDLNNVDFNYNRAGIDFYYSNTDETFKFDYITNGCWDS